MYPFRTVKKYRWYKFAYLKIVWYLWSRVLWKWKVSKLYNNKTAHWIFSKKVPNWVKRVLSVISTFFINRSWLLEPVACVWLLATGKSPGTGSRIPTGIWGSRQGGCKRKFHGMKRKLPWINTPVVGTFTKSVTVNYHLIYLMDTNNLLKIKDSSRSL